MLSIRCLFIFLSIALAHSSWASDNDGRIEAPERPADRMGLGLLAGFPSGLPSRGYGGYMEVSRAVDFGFQYFSAQLSNEDKINQKLGSGRLGETIRADLAKQNLDSIGLYGRFYMGASFVSKLALSRDVHRVDLNFNETDETPASLEGYTETTHNTISLSIGNIFKSQLFGFDFSYGIDWITLPIRLGSQSNAQLEVEGEGSDFLLLIKDRMTSGVDTGTSLPSVGFLTTHLTVLF